MTHETLSSPAGDAVAKPFLMNMETADADWERRMKADLCRPRGAVAARFADVVERYVGVHQSLEVTEEELQEWIGSISSTLHTCPSGCSC